MPENMAGGEINKAYYYSPVGLLEITASDKGIVSIWFVDQESESVQKTALIKQCIKELEEYFAGKRKQFSVLLDLKGSDFQKKVWNELLRIPFGKTVSYLHVAERLGDRNSTRAVGHANGQNPASIIVPCHRVIGASGKLVGYGGGIEKKRWLLNFERTIEIPDLFSSN